MSDANQGTNWKEDQYSSIVPAALNPCVMSGQEEVNSVTEGSGGPGGGRREAEEGGVCVGGGGRLSGRKD